MKHATSTAAAQNEQRQRRFEGTRHTPSHGPVVCNSIGMLHGIGKCYQQFLERSMFFLAIFLLQHFLSTAERSIFA